MPLNNPPLFYSVFTFVEKLIAKLNVNLLPSSENVFLREKVFLHRKKIQLSRLYTYQTTEIKNNNQNQVPHLVKSDT
jgi:hypothetical protein